MPRARTRKVQARIDHAVDWLEENQPATVRSVCYQLFVHGHIRDMSKSQTNGVSRLLVELREQGVIPWGWIVDETREVESAGTWDSPEQIIESAVKGYRRDNWQDQPVRVQVWSEKGTVRGVLKPVLDELGVDFVVAHGYQSATQMKATARESQLSTKPLHIIYVGDFDPSGMHMSEADIPTRLARYDGVANIERVALAQSDTKRGLPTFSADDKASTDTKKGDSRYDWFVTRYGKTCCELDAMNPNELRERVRYCIEELMEPETWSRSLMIERAEVESMGDFLKKWHAR